MNKQRSVLLGALALLFGPVVIWLSAGTSLWFLQPQDSTRPSPRFAIELPRPEGLEGLPPVYHVIQDRGSTSSHFFPPFLGRLPGAEAGAKADAEPSALELEYRVNNDVVEIHPTFFFGEFDRNKVPQSLAGLRKESLAVRSGRLNDAVTVSELERFGFRPITVKTVNAAPESPGGMQVTSRAPSIELAIVSEDRAGFMIAYHNISGRACTAFAVTTEPQPAGSQSMGVMSNWSKGLIAPGATLQRPFGVGGSGRKTAAGFVADAPRTTIVLVAALFEDGTFEGDPDVVARLEGGRDVARLQRQRVNQLVNSILDDPNLDDAARVARIRAEVPRLSEEPDAQVMEAIRARFPGLSSRTVSLLAADMKSAMRVEKESGLAVLDDFERLRSSHVPLSLAERWNSERAASSAPPR